MPEQQDPAVPFVCKRRGCNGRGFASIAALNMHVQRKHRGMGPQRGKPWVTKKTRKAKLPAAARTTIGDMFTDDKMPVCPHCGREFLDRRGLVRHVAAFERNGICKPARGQSTGRLKRHVNGVDKQETPAPTPSLEEGILGLEIERDALDRTIQRLRMIARGVR
jgi:hypothetical protein